MIEPRYRQRTLYEQAVETFMPDQKKLLWERWMLKVDELLEEDELVEKAAELLANGHLTAALASWPGGRFGRSSRPLSWVTVDGS